MSPARWRCWPRRRRAESAASSTSPRSPPVSPSYRCTAARNAGRKSWFTVPGSTGRSSARRPSTAPATSETLELFRMAKLGLMMMPPKGRVSVIHADDLSRLLLALAGPAAPSSILIEADDGKPGRLDAPGVRQGARRRRRHQGGRHLLARNPAPPRRPRRPAPARREGQVDHRPRGLFLPPQLGRRTQARLPAQPLAAADRHPPGPPGNCRLVSGSGLALRPLLVLAPERA